MIQSFYKQNPIKIETPYRELIVEHVDGNWQARLTGGEKMWPVIKPAPLKVTKGKNYEEAKEGFDKMYRELQEEGWIPYSPFEPW
jgi:hypothetical protein